jgi:hypothetical protein
MQMLTCRMVQIMPNSLIHETYLCMISSTIQENFLFFFTEGLLLYSTDSTTYLHPEMDKIHTTSSILVLNSHINIILLYIPIYSYWRLSFGFYHHTFEYISLPRVLHTPQTPFSLICSSQQYLQIMKLLIMELYPVFYYFISLKIG